jgi:hypothetical protein
VIAMLSKVTFHRQLTSLRYYCSSSSNITNLNVHPKPFRVATENENENHTVMSNSERFKYKTQATENFLSQNHTADRNTSVVEKIQVLSPFEFNNTKSNTMSEHRDRLGQWPVESESEIAGQGLHRIKNGRFNKVRARLIDFKKCLSTHVLSVTVENTVTSHDARPDM